MASLSESGMAPFASMHDRLRRRTRDLHDRVECAFLLRDRLASLRAYGLLLLRLHGLYRPLEEELSRLDWSPTGIRMRARCKSQLLKFDLLKLGYSAAHLRAAPRCRVPRLAGTADGLGWLYVLEGATLGGRIILREAESRLGVHASWGGSFFAGYREETGRAWQEFRDVLNMTHPESPTADAIEDGAASLFRIFEDWLSQNDAWRDDRATTGGFSDTAA